MLTLRPISHTDLPYLRALDYAMSEDDAHRMIAESVNRSSNGGFFELLLAFDGDLFIGIMNLFEHTPGVICVGPEIVRELRRRGYAAEAVSLAYGYAHSLGFQKASAQVRKNNTASIALHRKLGFTAVSEMINRHGNEVWIFEKSLP